MPSTESSWTINNKSYPTLTGKTEAEVVIVGGGVTGVFCAYVFSKAGLKVVVLEKDEHILQNTTLLTTAFITEVIDTSFVQLAKMFGEGKAKLVWRSGQEAINDIAESVTQENIDCELKFVSAYTYAKNEQQFKELIAEHQALQRVGFEATFEKAGTKLNFDNSGFLEIPQQAQFHPIKFAQGLADAAERAGAKIFTNSEVADLDGLTAKTKVGEIQAKNVVIATHQPFTNQGTRFKKAKYISYVFEIEIARNSIPEGLYLDMESPYHYFRIDQFEKFDRMIVGGEDHRADIKVSSQKNFKALEKYVKTILPNVAYKITRKWRGPILESIDGLPLIGAIEPHIFVATAFSGNGMTYSGVSAVIIRDLILNHKNPYASLYTPQRTPTLKQLAFKGIDYTRILLGGALKNFFSY